MLYIYICTTKPVTVANELDQRGRNKKLGVRFPLSDLIWTLTKVADTSNVNTRFCVREILVCDLRAEIGETGEDLNIIFHHDRL